MKIIEAMIDQNASEPMLDIDDLLNDIEITVDDAITDHIGESAFVVDANGDKKDVDLAKLKKALLAGVTADVRGYARDPVASHAEPTHLAKVGTVDSIARQLDLNCWVTGQIVVITREEEFKALKQKADAYDKLRGEFITIIDDAVMLAHATEESVEAIEAAQELIGRA